MTSEKIEQRLLEFYPDCQVAVMDLTGTQDHFEVRIASPSLVNLKRIEQHKAIMDVFKNELKTGEIHAFTIKIIPA